MEKTPNFTVINFFWFFFREYSQLIGFTFFLFSAEIKRVAESVLGVMTQCLQNDRIRQASPKAIDGGRKGQQALGNIVLKINAKLGGINVQIHSKDLM